jgi:hypothetical protein
MTKATRNSTATQTNQPPMIRTTDVVLGSRSLRLGSACLANAIAPDGRISIHRPSAPNSTQKKATLASVISDPSCAQPPGFHFFLITLPNRIIPRNARVTTATSVMRKIVLMTSAKDKKSSGSWCRVARFRRTTWRRDWHSRSCVLS